MLQAVNCELSYSDLFECTPHCCDVVIPELNHQELGRLETTLHHLSPDIPNMANCTLGT